MRFPLSSKYKANSSFTMLPPSVEQRGSIVNMPIMIFIRAKTGFPKAWNKKAIKKFVANPAQSTVIFFAVQRSRGSSICIPARDMLTFFGDVFKNRSARKCPASWAKENITAGKAMPFVSARRKSVSTAKNSGETSTPVLSTEKLSKSQGTPLGQYSVPPLSPQNADDCPSPSRCPRPSLFPPRQGQNRLHLPMFRTGDSIL